MHHSASLGTDVHGNITRINNLLNNIPARLDAAQKQLDDTRRQLETAKEELNKPFTMETELAAKAGRLAELDSQLNMDNAPDMGARDVSSACSENSGQNARVHGEAGNAAERQEDYAITTKIYLTSKARVKVLSAGCM